MTKLKDNFFEVERAGINTTFQDSGRKNFNHIGIPVSGVMDKRNYILANAILKKDLNSGTRKIIDWASQHPLGYVEFTSYKYDPFFNINYEKDIIEAQEIENNNYFICQ